MSTSSEIVDSGKKVPGESNFSQTFNLLTQYLKENGTLGDLTLGMSSSATGGMNPFPVTKKSWLCRQDSVSSQQVQKRQRESAQMTIFYGGQVIVLDDFPAEKAMEIIMLAGKGTYQSASDWRLKPTSTHKEGDLRLQPAVSDLPIARKASLARFLEKRKERITARAPYQSVVNPSMGDDSKEWVGFTSESGSQQS